MIRRRGMLIGIAALLVVSGLVALYLSYTRPIGLPPTGETLPPQCQISEALKREAHVSNPALMAQPDPSRRELVRHTHCFWRQTTDRDGADRRLLGIHVYDHGDSPNPRMAAESTYNDQRQPHEREVTGLGDRASVAQAEPDDNMQVTLLVLRDTRVYKVIYRGADRGFLFDRPYPVEEGERITKQVVAELMGAQK
ncbi:hypothetical protein Lesp02_25840 [Lentzea sp. NBRC 105346]|uniref:hypothetical protein n=1 Tax=Lentzea sp. NBRC 105346 TaxID=3032205 RepID=UPI0025572DAF|nr:hypothetical protein [Lentzea sp. NBRC 105346]GLZ30395.1 hypothetical protein Lesp02_25840 [Lentzea sp. NBRC 105346]